MRKALLSICLSVTGPVVLAQEQLGLALSDHAGTDALPLNPARLAAQWPWLDVGIAGLDAFVWNDRVALAGRPRTWLGEAGALSQGRSEGDLELVDLFGRDRYKAFSVSRVKGPSFALSAGRTGIGAHLAARNVTSVTGVDAPLADFLLNGLDHRPRHGERYRNEDLRVLSASWTEFGISAARIVHTRGDHLFSVGGTARYLTGHHGMALVLNTLDYTVIDSMQAQVHEASGHYAFVDPDMTAGSGWGLDLGVVYEHTLDDAERFVPHRSGGGCEPMDHDLRIGVSLIDLGGLRFDRATAGSFTGGTAYFPNYDAIDVNGLEGVDSLFRASVSSFTSESGLRIGLPTALSVQADKRIANGLYVAGAWVQQLSARSGDRLRRPNTLAVVPRYEKQRFAIAFPVLLREYDITRPALGVMFRFNSIVVGTDHLLPLVTRRDLHAADVYVRVKWTVFRGPYCRGKRSGPRTPGDQGAFPCADPQG